MTKIISKTEILSAIAYWGIRQSPYLFPRNIESALVALEKRIDEKKIFNTPKKNTVDGYLEITHDALNSLVEDLIFNTPEVAVWNITKIEEDNGITDPNDKNRTMNFSGASRHGPMQSQDNDFIDLYALNQNVCKMILEEV